MWARLSSRSGARWLRQRTTTSPSLHHPLLLLPGDGGEDVQVEASLLLACSPLLRRTLLPLSCCNFSIMTVVLPSITSASLKHLVEIVSHGSVTIACSELANFRDLLSILEIDLDKTSPVNEVTVKTLGGELKLYSKADQGLLSPPSTPYYASTDSTSENEIRDQSLSSTPSGANSQGITEANFKPPHTVTPLLISIPFGRLSSQTVQRITAKQETPNSPLSSYEAKPSSLKTKILPTRPPVSCIFCDIALPIGTDQDTCLQHFEVVFNAKPITL